MTKKTLKIVLASTAAAMLAACGHNNTWTVDGTIEGAQNQPLVLEASSNGRWYALDTVTLGENGRFSFTQDAAGYPDIYRLRLADRTVYFPVDSIETVTVTANANTFDTDYSLAGSSSAESLMQIDRRLTEAAGRLGAAAATDSLLKRELSSQLLIDPSGIVAYYIINKKIGGKPLFDPSNRKDLRVIGAVANAFSEQRPSDPRTAYLTNLFTSNRARLAPASAPSDTIHANALGVLDIQLFDERGKKHSLAELTEQGKPIVLNFIAYTADGSQAVNVALNKAYEKYRANGLEIFQVSVDPDEYQWQQSARNLPWITVYNSQSDGTQYLLRYNVSSIPTTFIIGSDGEIKERVEDLSKLDTALSRYL